VHVFAPPGQIWQVAGVPVKKNPAEQVVDTGLAVATVPVETATQFTFNK